MLRVSDTGVGIAPDMLPKIFEMFVQADRRTKNAQGGMGIGLTLVKSLVEMHGGGVEAHSGGLGKGSEFVAVLPLLSRIEEKGGRAEGVEPSQGRRPAPGRLLVVDDNAPAADTLAMVLRLEGHQVTVAHDGLSALEQAAARRPRCAAGPWDAPDGRLRTGEAVPGDPRPSERRAGCVTGWGQEEDRRRTKEAGFDLHLVKPVEPEVLHRRFADPQFAGREDAT